MNGLNKEKHKLLSTVQVDLKDSDSLEDASQLQGSNAAISDDFAAVAAKQRHEDPMFALGSAAGGRAADMFDGMYE